MSQRGPVRILFPPQFEPFQAYLAGPYLKALLAKYGVSATVVDANIDFYEWLLTSYDASARSSVPDGEASWPYLREHINAAVSASRRLPVNLTQYRWMINVLDEYCRVASPNGVRVGLTCLKVGNRYSAVDLEHYLEQSGNMFASYVEDRAEWLLGDRATHAYLMSLVVIDQLPAAVAIARELRCRRPTARVYIGGPLVSRLHRQLNAVPYIRDAFDRVSPGEGYRVLPELFGLPHLYTGHVTPDFSDLDLDRYWSCRRVLPYLVAHGCKWGKCRFCSHHLTYDGYRASPMDDVLSDLENLSSQFGSEYISFCDEYLTLVQLEELARGLLERDVGIKWSTFARPEPEFRSRDFLRRLYSAGCRMLMFGLESGSQRVINAMAKGTRVSYFRPILEACKEARVAVRYDFMVGFPGETEEDVQATFDFIRHNRDVIDTPFSSYSVAVFELRSGIPVLDQAEKFRVVPKDLLRGDLDDQYDFECPGALTEEQRIEWRERLIRYFKLEMDAEVICPQNKTHQLVLKDLFDRGLFRLPVLQIRPVDFDQLFATVAAGVEVTINSDGARLRNHANGGEIVLSAALFRVLNVLGPGTSLRSAFLAQTIWKTETFARFIAFLYRNDYICVVDREPNEARSIHSGGEHACQPISSDSQLSVYVSARET